MSETALSRDIRNALELAGYWVERVQSGKTKVRGAWMYFASEGTPDLLIVAPIYGWLEIKVPGKMPNEAQGRWHARAEKEGVNVATVRSVEDALRTAKGWKNAKP